MQSDKIQIKWPVKVQGNWRRRTARPKLRVGRCPSPSLRFSPPRVHPSLFLIALLRTLPSLYNLPFASRLIQATLLAQSPSLLSSSPDLFMQPELAAVSQHTPPVDSSPANSNPTQHGNDVADGPISGSSQREEAGDSAVPALLVPRTDHAPLSTAGSAPPSSPAQNVRLHESAGTPGKKGAEPGFQVVASGGPSKLPLETMPNGRSCRSQPRPRGSLVHINTRM